MEDFEKELNQNEEPVKADKPKSRKADKKALKFGVVAFVICACLLIYNIGGCKKNDTVDIYTFENNSNYQVTEYNGKLLTVNYDGIEFLNISGGRDAFVENHMSSPHVNISGDMILLYDKGNNIITVYDGTAKKYSYECDQPVKSAKVNSQGYCVLITDEVAYNSRVTLLDDKGKVAYIWKIGDEYIVDADISPDNKKLVAATITTNTGAVVENIVFVDIKDAKETGRVQSQGDMPLQVEYAESGNVIVVSDNKLCSYDNKAKLKWQEGFENNLLEAFEIDDSGNTAVSLKGIKNNSVIRTYTKNGSKSGEYTTETQVLHMGLGQKHIALYETGKISVINYSGNVVSGAEIKKEVNDVIVIGNDSAILLCNDCIQLFEF